jgi:hypothetical protein
MMIRNYATPTENSHHALSASKHRISSNTFKKGCDDDDDAARSVGVSTSVMTIQYGFLSTPKEQRPLIGS